MADFFHTFEELSEHAKSGVRDWFRQTQLDPDVAMSMSDEAIDAAIRAKDARGAKGYAFP